MRKLIWIPILLWLNSLSCQPQPPVELINLAHLTHLTETVTLGNRECDLVHIYAEHPDYHWVDANQEGIACVDDVARAAVFYLRYFEITRQPDLLENARRLLNFVRALQTEDGEFFNFVDEHLEINRCGRTSQASFDFWAARGYWALGLGSRIFQKIDPLFADSLQQAFLKCQSPLQKLLENYPNSALENGREYPTWLLNGCSADATSEFLLGLGEYLKIDPRPDLRDAARKLAEGLLKMQEPAGTPCAGAFLSWRQIWHAWGNAQSSALVPLSQTLNEPEYLSAVQHEADAFFAGLIVRGFVAECQVSPQLRQQEFPQIAYGVRGMTVGLLRLAEATGEIKYAQLAGLAAAWLFGNNAARTEMYQTATGRCFDGINDSTTVNLNSGAESTIEALLTLVELSTSPAARRMLNFRSAPAHSTLPATRFQLFRNPAGEEVGIFLNPGNLGFEILSGAALKSYLSKIQNKS